MERFAGLRHVALVPLDIETLRERAPEVVSVLGTYRRDTLAPTPGGLFDEAIFGRGDAQRFGRCVLPAPVPHPWLDEVELTELPVLPPELRPAVLRDGVALMSDLNFHYLDVLRHGGRLERMREIAAPIELRDATHAALAVAVDRVLEALWCSLRPDAQAALRQLDDAADLAPPGPRSLRRTIATLFACGLVAVRADSS